MSLRRKRKQLVAAALAVLVSMGGAIPVMVATADTASAATIPDASYNLVLSQYTVTTTANTSYAITVYNNNDTANISFQVDDPTVATISLSDGNNAAGAKYTIKALKKGTTNITCTYKTQTRNIKVNVDQANGPVDGTSDTPLLLSVNTLNLKAGGSYTFWTRNLNDAPNTTVSSSDPTVATVALSDANASGGARYAINALKAGTATITVRHGDETQTIKVTVNGSGNPDTTQPDDSGVAPGALKLNTTSVNLKKGNTYNLVVLGVTDTANIGISSSDTGVASVTPVGTNAQGAVYQITGIGKGNATITVSYKGQTASASVGVTEDGSGNTGTGTTPDSMKVNASNVSVNKGGTYNLVISGVTDPDQVQVTTSDGSVASVVKTGTGTNSVTYQITGNGKGNADIIITYKGQTSTTKVTVSENGNGSTGNNGDSTDKDQMQVSASSVAVKKGGTHNLVVTGVKNPEQIQITTGDGSVATVKTISTGDGKGTYEITGIGKGTTDITIRYKGQTSTTKVTVSDDGNGSTGNEDIGTVTSLKLDTSSVTIKAGSGYTFLVKDIKDSGNITVLTSDSATVRVDPNGSSDSRGTKYNIQGVKAGKATITVLYKGQTATFRVTVTEDAPSGGDTGNGGNTGNPSGNLQLDTSSVNMKIGATYTFLVKGNNDVNGLSVGSSNPNIASVKVLNPNDSRGATYQITAKSAGATTINVSYKGQSATIKVNVGSNPNPDGSNNPTGTALKLDTSSVTINTGAAYQFLVLGNNDTGNMTVTVDDPNVTSVSLVKANDPRGAMYQVVGKNPGQTTVRVNYKGQTATMRVNVTGSGGTSSGNGSGSGTGTTALKLDTSSVTMKPSAKYQFLVLNNNDTGNIGLSVDNPNVATVALKNAKDSRGAMYEITAKTPGTTTVHVTYKGQQATLRVNVTDNSGSGNGSGSGNNGNGSGNGSGSSLIGTNRNPNLQLDSSGCSVRKGETYQFLVLGNNDIDNLKVTSADPNTAKVELYNPNDPRGAMYLVKGNNVGTTKINVGYKGQQTSLNVNVTPGTNNVPAGTIIPPLELDTRSVNVPLGAGYTFLVKKNNDVSNIKAYSKNTNVAVVECTNPNDSRGAAYQIEGEALGETDIVVEYKGQTAVIKTYVVPNNNTGITQVTNFGSITLDTANYIMDIGDVYDVGLTILDNAGKKLTEPEIKKMVDAGRLKVWNSRPDHVVKMVRLSNGNYRLTGVREGSCHIVWEGGGNHASVRIDCVKGVKAHGTAVRNTSIFRYEIMKGVIR